MLKQLAVSDLTPGMMVTRVIEQSGPVKIRKVGFIRSPDMIKGLTEMGVILVEVNLDESLNVELEDEALVAAETLGDKNEAVSTKTATQRLVASNKQIADVDRQLSQQFHRSLFLPAVDQMPSKWTLYGKPYALLFVYVAIGLFIGGVFTYTIKTLTNQSQTIVTKPQNEGAFVASNTSAKSGKQVNTDDASSEDTTIATEDKVIGPKVDVTGDTSDLTADKANAENLSSLDPVPAQGQQTLNGSSNVQNSNSVNEQQLVNGVLLEKGQQLLGYQGTDDTNSEVDNNNEAIANNSPQNNNSNVADNSQNLEEDAIINSELFRRIQRVAKDVDSQPTEPVPELLSVTDLNDLPRIDQISPALLTQMPAMSFSAHMYASNPQDRWVRVNSARLGEGDTIANKVLLKRIESEKVVLEYKGTEFTMDALSDW